MFLIKSRFRAGLQVYQVMPKSYPIVRTGWVFLAPLEKSILFLRKLNFINESITESDFKWERRHAPLFLPTKLW